MKFNHSLLSLAIRVSLVSLVGVGVSAYADDSTDTATTKSTKSTKSSKSDDEVTADLGTLAVSFENVNRYAPVSSTGSAGLNLTNRETPQMISTINQARIKDQNLQTMEKVLENTAGIAVHKLDGSRTYFTSRGFAISQFSVDGADMDFNQQASIGEYHLNTALYDKIEITHGANSLVSGSGTPSARVNLVRKKANSSQRATSLSANANRFGNYGFSFDHNQALNKSGTVRGRVVGQYQDGKTFIDFEKKGQTSLYATVQADIGNKTTLDVGTTYQKNKQHGIMWGGLPIWFSDGTKANWDTDKNSSAKWTEWDRETHEYFANVEHRFNDNWQLKAMVSRNENKGSPKLLYQNSGVVDVTTGLVNYGVYPYKADNTNKSTHIQADLNGAFELFGRPQKLYFSVHQNKQKLGAYGYGYPSDLATPTSFLTWDGSFPEPTFGARGDTPTLDVTTKEQSLTGSVQLKPADKLSVILGSRVSNFDRTGVQWGTNQTTNYDNVWTPYAGLIWDFDKNTSAYASYTESFEPQTYRKANGEYLDPLEGKSLEVGLKGSTADGKLQSQVAIFQIKQDNYRKADGTTIVTGTEKEQAYIGVDGAKSTGVEIEITGKLSPHWQMTAGYQQVKAEDATGAKLNPEYSKRQAKLFTVYDMSRFVNGLTIGGGVNWKDSYYSVLTNPATNVSEKHTQKAFALVNLMGRYSVNKNLDLQLNVDNLFNKKYQHGVGFNQFIYGEPLNVSGSVTYRF